MGEFWLNAYIRTIPAKDEAVKRYGEELKATNIKDATKEAMSRIKALNEKERKNNSNKRYIINFIAETHRDMHLEDRHYWIDEQSFKELYPEEKYPK